MSKELKLTANNLLTISQFAKLKNVSIQKVNDWINKNLVTHYFVGELIYVHKKTKIKTKKS